MPVVMCTVDTTVLLQTVETSDAPSGELKPLPANLHSIRCPLPGLETCFHAIVTSILYHRKFEETMRSFDVSVFRGILLCGDHGVGKTRVVSVVVELRGRSTWL